MKNSTNKLIMCISIAALLSAYTFNVNAQNEARQRKSEFGVRFMPTFSSLKMKTSTGGTVTGNVSLGYGAGILMGYNFTNFVGIQTEIIYNSISQKYTEQDIERKINLRYVNIPLMLSINTGKARQVNLNIVLGPQIGVSVGSSVFTSGGDGTNNSKAVLSVKKGDLGFAYGAGLDFGLNPTRTVRLDIGYRGVYGLLDIRDNSNTIATDSYYILDRTQIKTNSVYIGFSFLF